MPSKQINHIMLAVPDAKEEANTVLQNREQLIALQGKSLKPK